MGVLRGVLNEELQNSLDMCKGYQEQINRIKGCLIKKKIGRRYYYYLARREGDKVKFVYRGPVSPQVKAGYLKQRKMLKKYQRLLLRVKGQISFLRRALRGKEAV
ncbi:MAG TPA: hypothetical protein PLJ26_02490 [Candidatus Omnitrophota bacterium]|nr:hypothetical protein [Candidatus Omnitrophota bacterium]